MSAFSVSRLNHAVLFVRSAKEAAAFYTRAFGFVEVSEEFGLHRGLGLIPGRVSAIPAEDADGKPHKVPFIGWAIALLAWAAFWLGTLGVWLLLMYKAYNRERYVLPIVGPLAEKQA